MWSFYARFEQCNSVVCFMVSLVGRHIFNIALVPVGSSVDAINVFLWWKP